MKKKHTMDEILKAKNILGLPSYTGRKEISEAFRELSKKYHPDSGNGKINENKIKEINAAYEVIKDYMEGYKFSFSKKDISRYNPGAGSSFSGVDDHCWGKK